MLRHSIYRCFGICWLAATTAGIAPTLASPIEYADVAVGASKPGVLAVQQDREVVRGNRGDTVNIGHACVVGALTGNAGNNWAFSGYIVTRYQIQAIMNSGGFWLVPINGAIVGPDGEIRPADVIPENVLHGERDLEGVFKTHGPEQLKWGALGVQMADMAATCINGGIAGVGLMFQNQHPYRPVGH
jgi:hypothetical protein